MGLKELRDVKLQIRELARTHLNRKQTPNTAATCPAGQHWHHGGKAKQCTADERAKNPPKKNRKEKLHPIFRRGIQHTSKAASAVCLLDLGLMDSRGAWTHTHTHTPTPAHTHAHTQTKSPTTLPDKIHNSASKALQCRMSIFSSNSPQ